MSFIYKYNLPRFRISSALMKALFWLLEELVVRNVPSSTTLKKIQMNIHENVGIPTIHCKSSNGNAFSFNGPRTLIANVSRILLLKHKRSKHTRICKDWSNPLVCTKIQRYLVLPTNGVISEVWHANKWRHDLERHVLSAMYDDKKEQYYLLTSLLSLATASWWFQCSG